MQRRESSSQPCPLSTYFPACFASLHLGYLSYLQTNSKPESHSIMIPFQIMYDVLLIVSCWEAASSCPELIVKLFKCFLGHILGPNFVSNAKCTVIYNKACNSVKPNGNGAIPWKRSLHIVLFFSFLLSLKSAGCWILILYPPVLPYQPPR